MASKAEELLTDSIRKRTSTTKTHVQQLVAKSRAAQVVFESFSQEHDVHPTQDTLASGRRASR